MLSMQMSRSPPPTKRNRPNRPNEPAHAPVVDQGVGQCNLSSPVRVSSTVRITKRRLAWLAGLSGLLIGTACALQFAFWNVGQEFGAYGQYHRVLRVVRSMDDFNILRHGVRRELKIGSLSHVEEFSLQLRDKQGRVGVVLFRKNTAEMVEKDESLLPTIVRDKFQKAIAEARR